MRINRISQNTYNPNFGVRVSDNLKKGLLYNLEYMKKQQNMSENKVLDYADKVKAKIDEMKTWDKDKDYLFDYKSGSVIGVHVTDKKSISRLQKAGRINQEQINEAENEYKKEYPGDEKLFMMPKRGWIYSPAKSSVAVSELDGVDWVEIGYRTNNANVDGTVAKAFDGKDFVESFLEITKEKYLAKRTETIDNFLETSAAYDSSGEAALNRAKAMGEDSGKIFKKKFFEKFPEKLEDITVEMGILSDLYRQATSLFPHETRFGGTPKLY